MVTKATCPYQAISEDLGGDIPSIEHKCWMEGYEAAKAEDLALLEACEETLRDMTLVLFKEADAHLRGVK